jgi:calcineurin-like phosphoesterase family protein
MVKLWFFSDPHFGHRNIIDYCQRPFASAQEMDEHIIERINSVVKPGDHWYCLGDWSIKRPQKGSAKRLNGRGRLIMGNHDIYRVEDYLAAGIEKVMAYRVINGIMFSHIPIHPASFSRFRANVHGHIHNNDGADYGWPYINLSVEVINYTPVSLEELEARINGHEQSHKA